MAKAILKYDLSDPDDKNEKNSDFMFFASRTVFV